MFKINVIEHLCKACGYCKATCPKNVIDYSNVTNKMGYKVVETVYLDKCVGCMSCAVICPEGAIEIYKEEQ